MGGSEAEERIRAKVVAQLRAAVPGARIIHELEMGGVRLDVAAVTPDRIVVAEVKSERDTLDRLQRQVRGAVRAAGEVWVCVADRHADEVDARRYPFVRDAKGAIQYGADRRPVAKEGHFDELRECLLWRETPASLELYGRPATPKPPLFSAMFSLLHVTEMRESLAAFSIRGLHRKPSRDLIQHALEEMSGRDLRRAVCAHLRARTFFRADDPMTEVAA